MSSRSFIWKAVIWSVVKNMPGYIHHVEWCVKDLKRQVNKLISHFGFRIVSQRLRHVQPCWQIQQILVQSGDTLFLLTEKTRDESCNLCKYEYIVWKKREILPHRNFFSSNQVFSNFFSKNVAFTKFWSKMHERKLANFGFTQNRSDRRTSVICTFYISVEIMYF